MQVWKYCICHAGTELHFIVTFRHCISVSVKSMWVGARGCAVHLAGFDGFSLYCSGAQWAQNTVECYWSQSESEGELVSSLQANFLFHSALYSLWGRTAKTVCLQKGISENMFAVGVKDRECMKALYSSVNLLRVPHISAHSFQCVKVYKLEFSCAH